MSKKDVEALSELAMWEDWQDIVRRSLPNFCASPIYVQQRSQTQDEFESAAQYVAELPRKYDLDGKTRDARFGGLVRTTKACGDVTRMWIDSNVEIDFLQRSLHPTPLSSQRILDIGAGYGRLAVAMAPLVKSYACVDPVPISTGLCKMYTAQYTPRAKVWELADFCAAADLAADLAINIHSWNECSLTQVGRWLEKIKLIPHLFTVSNGHLSGGRSAYSTWGGKGESFRPLLEKQYDLLAEEEVGLSHHPHALWRLK
jgi:SAM-dependent methyltransferase